MSTRGEARRHVLVLSLDRFDLSTRTANCLHLAKVSTVEGLAAKTANDVLAWQNAGQKTLGEIRKLLGRVGLKLVGDPFPVGALDPKLLAELAIDPAEIAAAAATCELPSTSSPKAFY